MKPTESHRLIYRLLVNRPEGYTREDLAAASGLGDRGMRRIIEEVRTLAATTIHPTHGRPVVIGFDPETERYVAAQDAEQANRICAYYAARLAPMAETVRVQRQAASAYKPATPKQAPLLTAERTRAGGPS